MKAWAEIARLLESPSRTLRAARHDPRIGKAKLQHSCTMLANEQRKRCGKKTIANVIGQVIVDRRQGDDK